MINLALNILLAANPPIKSIDLKAEPSYTSFQTNKPLEICEQIATDLAFSKVICTGANLDTEKLKKINSEENFEKLNFLSIALRRLGEFKGARLVLEYAIRNAKAEQKEILQLSLANLSTSLYLSSFKRYKGTDNGYYQQIEILEASKLAETALQQYRELSVSDNIKISSRARINWLLLISNLDSSLLEFKEIQNKNQEVIPEHVSSIKEIFQNSEVQDQLELRFKFITAIIKVSETNRLYTLEAEKQIEETLNLAKVKGNKRDLSNSLGLKGLLYIKNNNIAGAQLLLTEASNIATVVRAADLAYKWDWELGKIAKRLNNKDLALQYYKSSITQLEIMREKLLQFQATLQLDFLDQNEQLYNEYLALLFQEKEPDLRNIIRINEKIKIAELENYLQCNLDLKLVSILDLDSEQSPDAAIYIINLPDKYYIITRYKDGSLSHHSANKEIIDKTIRSIKIDIQSNLLKEYNEFEFQKKFSLLYKQILAPVENRLHPKGTIIFSVDSNLQNIPWGLLYDGKYLLEKYSIALTLGSKLSVKGVSNTVKLSSKPFIAGIIESPTSEFPNLPYVADEVRKIKELFPQAKYILDNKFTSQNLFRQSQDSAIIHIASHGDFSSDPRKTYLLSWDGKLKLSDLSQLIKARTSPIELLVLSGCDTATGDRRAILGLAGATAQAGALSSIGTLWRVDDASQATLMQEFYAGLKSGKSRAESLRMAQLKLLHENWAIYHWAAPVLVGAYM